MQTQISDFSDVIYNTSLSRNTKILDYFAPQKWDIYVCSMCLHYSVSGFTDNQPC